MEVGAQWSGADHGYDMRDNGKQECSQGILEEASVMHERQWGALCGHGGMSGGSMCGGSSSVHGQAWGVTAALP